MTTATYAPGTFCWHELGTRDRQAAKVAELGGKVLVPPTQIPVGKFCMFNDPTGTFISMIAPSEG